MECLIVGHYLYFLNEMRGDAYVKKRLFGFIFAYNNHITNNILLIV